MTDYLANGYRQWWIFCALFAVWLITCQRSQDIVELHSLPGSKAKRGQDTVRCKSLPLVSLIIQGSDRCNTWFDRLSQKQQYAQPLPRQAYFAMFVLTASL